jgi:hypothetical protein
MTDMTRKNTVTIANESSVSRTCFDLGADGASWPTPLNSRWYALAAAVIRSAENSLIPAITIKPRVYRHIFVSGGDNNQTSCLPIVVTPKESGRILHRWRENDNGSAALHFASRAVETRAGANGRRGRAKFQDQALRRRVWWVERRADPPN